MRRVVTGLSWGLLAAWPWAAIAAGDGPPPVSPPEVSPPALEPPAELPKVLESSPIPDNRPVLVIPGLTTPRSGRRSAAPSPRPTSTSASPLTSTPTATPGPALVDGLPPLIGPAEMPRTEPLRGLPADQPGVVTGRRSLPLTVESVPASPDELADEHSDEAGSRRRSLNDVRNGSSTGPRRAPSLFNRMLPFGPSDRGASGPRSGITVEPRSDPAADAAAKRRIERQIREVLGSKLRSYDVRVVGREVTVHARSSRFWQRRAVRNALESLPALSGYRTSILVDE
jgi:hypothetical protein